MPKGPDKTIARILAALVATPDDKFERFRNKYLRQQCSDESLFRARSLLTAVGEALAAGNADAWQRVDDAFFGMGELRKNAANAASHQPQAGQHFDATATISRMDLPKAATPFEQPLAPSPRQPTEQKFDIRETAPLADRVQTPKEALPFKRSKARKDR